MTNHITAPELADVAVWFKSSYSGSGNNCVEIADLTATSYGAMAVRDSKDPDGPALLVSPKAFADLVAFAKTFTL